jgi:glyoxylase-like metal-dependent hydrolase (beta-lactamase superfamily II)/ferredoxin
VSQIETIFVSRVKSFRRGVTEGLMATAAHRLSENAAGSVFVDDTCIDCDACRQIAPEIFSRSARAGQSVVGRQPRGPAEEARAAMALVACPTASIGADRTLDVKAAARAFPELIAEDVYYCGYHSEASYGASSYLIRRPNGNVLVDSPRAAGPLIEKLRALGGARWMFLSHRDDVADHQKFHDVFGCERILHSADVSQRTLRVERQISGTDPVRLDEDLLLIPVPGHTAGSTALLYREKFLFTGDHLWADEDDGRLAMGRRVCWYSWDEQVRSLERLLGFRFEWVLPGHRRRFHASTPQAMHLEIVNLFRAQVFPSRQV